MGIGVAINSDFLAVEFAWQLCHGTCDILAYSGFQILVACVVR